MPLTTTLVPSGGVPCFFESTKTLPVPSPTSKASGPGIAGDFVTSPAICTCLPLFSPGLSTRVLMGVVPSQPEMTRRVAMVRSQRKARQTGCRDRCMEPPDRCLDCSDELNRTLLQTRSCLEAQLRVFDI